MELRERVQAQPAGSGRSSSRWWTRSLEQARSGPVLSVARDALEQLRLDLEMARFDLDATRRERESLRQLLNDRRVGARRLPRAGPSASLGFGLREPGGDDLADLFQAGGRALLGQVLAVCQ